MSRTIAIAVITLTFAAFSRAEEHPRTISTTGDATIHVVPDKVIITLGIETFNESLEKVRESNQEKAKSLVNALKAIVDDEKDIQTENINITLKYKPNQAYSEGLDGYIAHRRYTVTLKDAKKVDEVVSAALKSGANQLHGITYHSSEMSKHQAEARKQAIREAKKKAVELANELDCMVGLPRTITDEPHRAFDAAPSFNLMSDSGGGTSTIMLGQIPVYAEVGVTFDLQTK